MTAARTTHRGASDADAATDAPAPRWGVLIAVLAAVGLAAWGAGAFGGDSITEAAGGWLDADSTPLAPASGAFRIWSVIYLGLLGYAVWRLTPSGRSSPRARRADLWVVGSALLNAAWIAVVQADQLALSVGVILVLLVVLVRLHLLLGHRSPAGRLEATLLDGVFGLYLGWVCVAVVANIAAWAGSLVDPDRELGPEVWVVATAVGVLVVVAALGLTLSASTGRRLAPVLAIAWGTAWIAVGRTEGRFEDVVLVVAAALTAAVVLLVPLARRIASGPARPSG